MTTPDTLRCWADIHLSALSFNLRRFRLLISKSTEIMGVVKADAYGHGLFTVARALAHQRIHLLAVANITEAAIASCAAPRADILLLSPLLPSEFSEIPRHPRWIPTLSNLAEARLLEHMAIRQRKKVSVHVKLDTGMGRLGEFPLETLKLLRFIENSLHLRATGLYSHLSSADSSARESLLQWKHFQSLSHCAEAVGYSIPPLHLQNSTGLLRIPATQELTAIRPGLALYGVTDRPDLWKKRFGKGALQGVLSWHTRIGLIRHFPRGATLSYDRTFKTRAPMRVAILCAGYADGISRKLSNRGKVLIHGHRCPIVGRVTMDMILADVTRVPSAKWGDTATLLGKNGSGEITAHEVAQWAETNSYEILCNISKRVPRIVRN